MRLGTIGGRGNTRVTRTVISGLNYRFDGCWCAGRSCRRRGEHMQAYRHDIGLSVATARPVYRWLGPTPLDVMRGCERAICTGVRSADLLGAVDARNRRPAIGVSVARPRLSQNAARVECEPDYRHIAGRAARKEADNRDERCALYVRLRC